MAQHPHLQVVTYHWYEADNSMIYVSMAKSNRQDYPASATAAISAGTLNRLPLEVIHNVLGHLDISTIGSVRRMSWHSRLIVDLFPLYRDLATHASSVLRVLYSTHLASTYSVGQLYTVLTNDRCVCCEAFGPYLSLITCERCCFSCLYDPKMAPTTLSTAASAFGLSKDEKDPCCNNTPRNLHHRAYRKKEDIESCERKKGFGSCPRKSKQNSTGGEDLTNLNKKARDLIRHYNDAIRFMVLTPIPYLNTREHRSESGVWCRGCELVWYRSSSRRWSSDCYKRVLDTAYLEEEYLRHFEECEAAKELWGLYVREGKGLEHLHRGRHREWASRNVERRVVI